MRNTLIAAIVVMTGSWAFAQSTAGLKSAKQTRDAAAAEAADETADQGDSAAAGAPVLEGSATVDPKGNVRAGDDGPGAEHKVERGDTLWDLSQRYLGSPWYWPKVWSYNPDIANPHWIYPGNLVRFFNGGGDEAPTQVEIGKAPAQELPDVEEGNSLLDETIDTRVAVAGKIGYVPKSSITLSAVSFVTPEEVDSAGVIAGSFREAELLTSHDPMYISFHDGRIAKIGEQYVIFRNGGEVSHPVTGELVGYQTRILGTARIIRVDKAGMATATITNAYEAMERGNLVGPMNESVAKSVAVRPNDKNIQNAFVVSATQQYLSVFGEHQMIWIDRGADDGVKAGNVFKIWRQQDPLPQQNFLNPTNIDEEFPREDVAACMAFEVKSKVTSCLMISSFREVVKGDKAEMRAASSTSAR